MLDLYGRTREEGFGPEVKRRIILGTYVLSSGYYDAYYLRAQKVRELIRRDFANVFEKVDALISPTSPVPAFKLGERAADPLQMYLADIFTIAANLAGICGISLPCGFAEVDGNRLPIGLQLLGKALDEARILQIAHAYEQSTDWHKARPPIAANTPKLSKLGAVGQPDPYKSSKAAEHRRTPKRKRQIAVGYGHVLECGTAVPLFHRCGPRSSVAVC